MDAANTSQTYQPVETASPLVSLNAFYVGSYASRNANILHWHPKGKIWTGAVLCISTCTVRVYLRYMCFRKLLPEDWLMLLALGMLLSVTALGQVYLKDIYMLRAVTGGDVKFDPEFPEIAQRALRSFGVTMLLTYLGIWAIKLNFLLFFRRLIIRITSYLVFWWVVFIIIIACGAVSIGTLQYHCLFGPINHIMTVCGQYSNLRQTYTIFKISCIVDVISDVLSRQTNTL